MTVETHDPAPHRGALDWLWYVGAPAVGVDVPMYTNAAGAIPIVEALRGKVAALGTTLAFMMSVIALSLPEMIILKQVLKLRLIAIFIAVDGKLVHAGGLPDAGKLEGWLRA